MKRYHIFPLALLAVFTLAGCNSVPVSNPLLNEARSDYSAAKNNPQVVNLAPGELKQASDAIDKANEASSKNEDEAVINHLAYLAKQRAAIAQETAKQKAAEAVVASAGMERSATRLEARTAEANRAQQSADESQRQAAISQQQTREAQLRSSKLETELKELHAKKTERGMVITLGDVLFDTNKAELKSSGTRNLQKLAAFLTAHPELNVLIEGYTDNTGSAEYNLGLSERRCNSVKSALVQMGISRDRITTHGYGLESPVANNATAAGRQKNRRVEIVFPNNSISTP